MSKICFGIDVGGTTVKIGILTEEGQLTDSWEIPTRKEDNGSHILEDVAASVEKAIADKGYSREDVVGVGLGIPGPVTDDGT
ncbi:MAG: ROK family protein, partial [Clostridiales bacterium]|nr:ROK family protein [Clostridiales bacterium]MDY3747162.1 ROK family protein [Lachnospiraceae bacterium]